jgi:6-phosphogluconolactonase (cycloisomerase 2 family)
LYQTPDQKKEILMTCKVFYHLGRFAAFLVLLIVPNSLAFAASEWAYIGTYTPEPGSIPSQNHGEGIYLVRLDTATGALSGSRLVAKTMSPSWIALSPDGKTLYAGNEVSDFNGSKSGSVTAFVVKKDNGNLTLLNTVSSGGAGPAYVAVDPSGKYVLVANYAGGSLAVLPIRPDGSLGEASDVIRRAGPLNRSQAVDNPPGNFAPSDHQGSHLHMVGFDPEGRYVIADDAGLDQILVWKLDLASGKLTAVSATAALPGSAPRHFVFDPAGHHFYQLQEQDSILTEYDFDSVSGHLKKRQSLSALPPGFAGSNLASELLISRDGRYLYSGNRSHDSIAIFSAGRNGHVTRLSNVPTEGDKPRSLALDPTGHYLFSLNQGADSVTSFHVDPKTGLLYFTGHYLPLGSPATMVFLP